MASRVQVLTISKRRLLSVATITRPPPSTPTHSILSPRFNSAGFGKFSLKSPSATKDEKTDCYFKTADLIDDARKLVEDENIVSMLHNCKTIIQLKQVHLQIIINGMRSDDNDHNINSNNNSNYSLLADKLMLFSKDIISFDYAYRVFMDLPSNPSLPAYNTLISCSIGKSDYIAVSAYNRMRNYEDNIIISPDRFTLAFLLKSLACFDRLESGETIHGQVIKLGFVSDAFVMSSLLEFYFKFVVCHYLRAVGKLFDEMPERDILSWNTMISALVHRSLDQEALSVFDKMLLSGCKPDETTLLNILSACNSGDFMEQGKWLDSYVKENKFVLSVPLGNALIDMFVSFGDLGDAKMVFKSMSKRCTTTWKRMMSGLVHEGFCKEALVLFDIMCCCSEEGGGGIKPDNDIFWWVLLAFDMDEMLVGDGKQLFKVIHQIVHECGVKPNDNHYQKMILILRRAGWVEAAIMLLESLSFRESDYYCLWGSVLFACQVHGDNLLLDSLIRKMYDNLLVTKALHWYIDYALARRRNDDFNYGKPMVETLIRKLPDQKYVEELNVYLEREVQRNASIEAYFYNQGFDYSSVHPQQTVHPQHHDDVFKLALQSLDRQLLIGNSHDQMIGIIDDPLLAN